MKRELTQELKKILTKQHSFVDHSDIYDIGQVVMNNEKLKYTLLELYENGELYIECRLVVESMGGLTLIVENDVALVDQEIEEVVQTLMKLNKKCIECIKKFNLDISK